MKCPWSALTIKTRESDVVEIVLATGRRAYGRALANAVIASYDIVTSDELAPDQVVKQPVAFKAPCNEFDDYVSAAGKWLVPLD
jgi:hypothetical protein